MVKIQSLMSSLHELENGTPQGSILCPFLFNLLMKQLVALPFHDDTVLLSYADDLSLEVTGRVNKFSMMQQALHLISRRCEELGLKISAEKSRPMVAKAADPREAATSRELGWPEPNPISTSGCGWTSGCPSRPTSPTRKGGRRPA
ncbi:hypothetical protein E2C01_050770 [Portunus trituberculatus]|uniref:Reverse transcriptase domain-containing protein n=1 Tax=Portunus trituberculatus TaxID=210409 RepID=A0A5B7GHC9_PORTR|nr:hypothetical protein [Portunus trituberculatus]